MSEETAKIERPVRCGECVRYSPPTEHCDNG